MKTIGVIVNQEKDTQLKYTRVLIDSITKMGGTVKVSSDIACKIDFSDQGLDDEAVLDNSEIIVCLGGDGTFLKVARSVYKKDVPILGINLGTLGFLTEVDKNDIDCAVEHIINNKYTIEKRMMLETIIKHEELTVAKDMALNDIVISRGALSRILHVKTYINDAFVDTFPGDGLIVASPTGSTAYSLSAGGPIVEPDIDTIIITPICPHILYSRSVVTTGDRTVKVIIDENYTHNAMVTVDGQEGYEVHGGDIVEIKRAPFDVKLVRINSRNFFNVLRSKIYYRGENLRENEI